MSLPLIAAGVAATKFASDFEASTTKLVTLSGISESQMKQMRQAVLDLAPTVGIGPNALSNALLVVTSTGFQGADAMDILSVAAKSSAVGMGDTKDVARALTAAMSAYGVENLSAAQAGDILFQTVVQGGAEATELAGTLGTVIGVSSQLGVSFSEVGAFIATYTRLGVDAAEATTGLRGVLTTILSPSAEAAKALQAIGMSADDLRAKVAKQGLGETLISLLAQLKASGGADAIGAVFGNVRALAGVLGTAGSQMEGYRTNLDAITNSAGGLNAAFEQTKKTFQFQWAQFTAEAEKLAITLGAQLLPSLEKLLQASRPLATMIVQMIGWFSQLPQPVQTAALGLVAFVAALGPITYVAGSLMKAGSAFLQLWQWAGKLTEAGGLLSSAWSVVMPAFEVVGTVIGGLVTAFGGWAVLLGGVVLAGIIAIGVKTGVLQSVFSGLWEVLKGTVGLFVDLGTILGEGVIAGLSAVWGYVSNLSIWSDLADGLKMTKDGFLALIPDVVQSTLSWAAATLKEILGYVHNIAAVGFSKDNTPDAPGHPAMFQGQTTAGPLNLTPEPAYESHVTAKTKEQIEAAKRMAEALKEITAAQIPLTAQQEMTIAMWDKMGVSSDTAAKALGISSVAVKNYTEGLERSTHIAKEWASMELEFSKPSEINIAFLKKELDAQNALAAARGGAQDSQLKALVDFHEKSTQLAMHGTELQLHNIELERSSAINALEGQFGTESELYKMASAEVDAYYNHQIDLATMTADTIVERMRAAGVATQQDLEDAARGAQLTYEQMRDAVDSSGNHVFGANAIEAARQRSVGATDERNGPSLLGPSHELGAQIGKDFVDAVLKSTSLGSFFSNLGLSIVSSIGHNLGASLGEMGKKLGGALGGFLGSALPILGDALGPLLGKLVDHFFGTKGRDAVKDFASSMGGFEALHKQLDALPAGGEALWIALTQGVGRNNPAEAKKAIEAIQDALAHAPASMQDQASSAGYETNADLQAHAQQAVALYQFIRDSGQYSAAAVQKAWEAANAALVASGDQQAIAAQAANAAITELDGKIKGLQDSIANEAPEEVMGVIEQQTRAQIAALEEQRAAAQTNVDSLQASFQPLIDHGFTIPIHFSVDPVPGLPNGSPSGAGFGPTQGGTLLDENGNPVGTVPGGERAPGMATGGIVRGQSGGTLINVGEGGRDEAIVPLSGGSSSLGSRLTSTVIFEVDGRVIAEAVVPHVPGVVQRFGLA